MPDVPHFWKLLALRRVEVRVTIQPKIDCSRYEDNSAGRKRLAEDCYNRVLGRVNKRDYAQEDEERALANASSPAMYRGQFCQ